jgi:hypothetical protein
MKTLLVQNQPDLAFWAEISHSKCVRAIITQLCIYWQKTRVCVCVCVCACVKRHLCGQSVCTVYAQSLIGAWAFEWTSNLLNMWDVSVIYSGCPSNSCLHVYMFGVRNQKSDLRPTTTAIIHTLTRTHTHTHTHTHTNIHRSALESSEKETQESDLRPTTTTV